MNQIKRLATIHACNEKYAYPRKNMIIIVKGHLCKKCYEAKYIDV